MHNYIRGGDGGQPHSIHNYIRDGGVAHPHSILITSHSKDLGLAGERIGYIALHPEVPDRALWQEALVFTNRILGFVNAPAWAMP